MQRSLGGSGGGRAVGRAEGSLRLRFSRSDSSTIHRIRRLKKKRKAHGKEKRRRKGTRPPPPPMHSTAQQAEPEPDCDRLEGDGSSCCISYSTVQYSTKQHFVLIHCISHSHG